MEGKNIRRCSWVDSASECYHDNEWGKPSHDDDYLFEMLLLESFQAGLSWVIILKKREGFRRAFDGFDYKKIAEYTSDDIERLVHNDDIVKSRGKIAADRAERQSVHGDSERVWFIQRLPVVFC